jgi:hypothetical protein
VSRLVEGAAQPGLAADQARAGQVTAATPPVLDADREHHDALEPLVKEALAIPTQAEAIARGTFRRATTPARRPAGSGAF